MGLYTAKSGLILGFHGCELAVRDRVVLGTESLEYHKNDYDWLGFGNYFWENNYQRALHFAENRPAGKAFDAPAVLGAVIDLDHCLDLLDAEGIQLVRDSFDVLAVTLATAGKPLPKNKNVGGSSDLLLRFLDRAVIEYLHEQRMEGGQRAFDSVRGMFPEGDELYPNAGFRDKNHIQICVRNPNCIKGFFIPRQEQPWPLPDDPQTQ